MYAHPISNSNGMRLLGIDYGSKRVGLALSSEDGTMAFPREVMPNDGALLKKVVALIEAEGVEMVIIGHSLDRDGEKNPIQERIDEFMTDLTLETGLPIELEPEFYTTKAALRLQGKTGKTDASAAALILDSYITRTK